MITVLFYKFALAAPNWIGPIMSVLTTEPGAEGHGGENAGSGEHGGTPHLPSLISILFGQDGAAHHYINLIYSLVTALILIVVVRRVYAKRKMIPGPLQNFIEILVEGMYNFLYSILGKDARKYTPFLGTLFFYILINNFMGIIPLGHSPSVDYNTTAGLALCTFGVSQYTGIKRLGLGGWLYHLIGQPTNVAMWVLSPLFLLIHIVGEVAKPLSLSLRLFGNITGEDILVAAFVGLGVSSLAFIHLPVGLPLQTPFILLGILLSTIQALVFTLLSSIYILMMLPHGEDH